jgi:hypothetical protein
MTADRYFELWLQSYLRTNAVELPLYVWLLGRGGVGRLRAAVLAVAVNALTHPTLWFLVPQFEPYPLWFALAEAGVAATELVLVWLGARPILSVRHAFFAAVGANAASAALGLFF